MHSVLPKSVWLHLEWLSTQCRFWATVGFYEITQTTYPGEQSIRIELSKDPDKILCIAATIKNQVMIFGSNLIDELNESDDDNGEIMEFKFAVRGFVTRLLKDGAIVSD